MLRYHRYIALAAAFFLLMQGFTGATLVFRESVEPIVHPELKIVVTGQRSTPEQLLNLVDAHAPDFRVTKVKFPTRADRAIIFKLSSLSDGHRILVAIDPYRNTIVREGNRTDWPIEWMLIWHQELHGDTFGKYFVGLVGLALMFMIVSGLIVWWPRGKFSKGFRIVWGGKDPTWRTAHRTFGALAAIVLIFSTTTGMLLVFKEPLRDLLSATDSNVSAPAQNRQPRSVKSKLSIDALVQRAEAEIGPAPLRELRLRGDDGEVISILFDGPRARENSAENAITYNRYTGEEVSERPLGGVNNGASFIDYLLPLHTGKYLGTGMRIALLFGALMLTFLALSGPMLWASRLRRKATSKKKGTKSS